MICLFLGISIGQGKREKKIKDLELANRVMREALESERRKVETLSDFRGLERGNYAKN
ncbi:MAG: hypothetical protein QHH14_11300 [Clostridiales bacterium]|nr:hypothetical protein [Clostridiales bacterium]